MSERPDPATLELSAADMRAMADEVVARSVEHIASVERQPSRGDVDAAALCRSLREPAPEQGTALGPLLDHLFRDCIPRSFTTIGPGYLAYIPGGGLYPAALADFIADTTNRFTGIWQAAPVLVQLEANALDWLRDWMGFPDTTRGLFTTGGSMATFNAILCARERLLGADIRRGVLVHLRSGASLGVEVGQDGRHHARSRSRRSGRRHVSSPCRCSRRRDR